MTSPSTRRSIRPRTGSWRDSSRSAWPSFPYGVVGFIGYLSVNWNVSVAKAIKADPKPIYWTPQAYFGHLFGLMPDAFVLLSIAVMVATVFGRSLMSAVDLYKGKERFLAGIVVLVLVVIAGAFLIDRYY